MLQPVSARFVSRWPCCVAGILVTIPYGHTSPAEQTASAPRAASTTHAAHAEHATPGRGGDHMLVASVTRITLSRYGEDFSAFMDQGALQRMSAQFFLDVFCHARTSARHGLPGLRPSGPRPMTGLGASSRIVHP